MGKKGYGSAFGAPQRTCYCYIKYLNEYYKRKFNVLVIDALDGIHVLPFARKNNLVDCYETNKTLLYGGVLDGFNIIGLKEKMNIFKLNNLIKIYEENFYEKKCDKKYDFVYVYRSLHLNRNKNIINERKIRKILSSVKENGYVYILYHLADNEKDYINFPKNQYFRKGEIARLFDERWDIIDNHERKDKTIHNRHPFNCTEHKHKVGYIFARKKSNRVKYKYHYNFIFDSIY